MNKNDFTVPGITSFLRIQNKSLLKKYRNEWIITTFTTCLKHDARQIYQKIRTSLRRGRGQFF